VLCYKEPYRRIGAERVIALP